MEATGAKDYRKECRYGAKCYQKNPEHKSKFKHTEREKVDREREGKDKENQQQNKQQPENLEAAENKKDMNDGKNMKRLFSQDSTDDEVDAKKPKHAISESESGDTSQDDEEASKDSETTSEVAEKEVKEYSDLLPLLVDPTPKQAVEQAMGLIMPPDFYELWEFAKSVSPGKPLDCLAGVGLKLCGAYEVLAGAVPSEAPRSKELFLTHHRYYYDPPELQTVVCEDSYSRGVHLGYFRDSPTEAPVMVVSGVETVGAKLTAVGDNLFGGIYNHLSASLETVDPFTRSKVAATMERVKLWVNRRSMEGSDSLNLDRKTAGMKNRDRVKVATGGHSAGIVVPYNRKTEVGYREVPETAANLKKMFTKVVEAEGEEERDKAMDAVQELVTFVQFANDEGDPGMGLELGLALFSHGGEALHSTIRHLMGVAYDLLDRDQFSAVLTAHLARRGKGAEPDSFLKWRK